MSGAGEGNGAADDGERRVDRRPALPPVRRPGEVDDAAPDGVHRTEAVPFPLPPLPDPAAGGPPDGVHRTEAVPFPLPPLPAGAPEQGAEQAPGPAPDETARLQLGRYPPVPPPVRRSARPDPGDTPADPA